MIATDNVKETDYKKGVEIEMDKCKSVLFFFHYSDANSGGIRSMLDLIDHFLELGNIKMYAAFPELNGTAIPYLQKKGVEVLNLRHVPWNTLYTGSKWDALRNFPRRFRSQCRNLIFLAKVGEIVRKEKIDCIYSNTFACVAGALCSKVYKLKHIWHVREFGLQDHYMYPLFGWKCFYHLLNHWTDKIIVISESLRDRYLPFVPGNKISVIYDDISPVFINDTRTPSGDCVNILIAGTVQPGKRQIEAIQATQAAKEMGCNVHLYIAGGGQPSYMKLLKEYVQQHNMESYMTFLGHVINMNQLRSKMDIGLVCSQSEAFGRVTVEGMLSHMAMIGARSAGTSELIRHGETGYLYELGNYMDLAEQIAALCKDEALRDTIAEGGYQSAKERFTQGQCADAIWRMIQDI